MIDDRLLKVGHLSTYTQRARTRVCGELHPEAKGVVLTDCVLVVVLTSPKAPDYPRPRRDPYLIVDIPLCQACADRLGLGKAEVRLVGGEVAA